MLCADERLPSEPWSERPRYFRGIAVRSYTVPIVEKFVERAKADSEPTRGYRPYCTAETPVNGNGRRFNNLKKAMEAILGEAGAKQKLEEHAGIKFSGGTQTLLNFGPPKGKKGFKKGLKK